MAWETRGKRGRRYYYRPQRNGSRVEKTYLGCGPAAVRAAERDAEARARRDAEHALDRQAAARLEATFVSLDQLMSDFDSSLALLTQATLLAGGLYQHHGQWRRRLWSPPRPPNRRQ